MKPGIFWAVIALVSVANLALWIWLTWMMVREVNK